jgi:hypothetical protein
VNPIGNKTRWVLAGAVVLGCAAQQQRTIEPIAAGESTGSASGEDAAFVLSRRANQAKKAPIQLNTGDKWWGYRARALQISEGQARARDAEMSEVRPPEVFWDRQTAVEVVSVWSAVCNECHGGRRKMEDAVDMPAPPEGWGKGEGLFFGARRRYSEVFAVVYRGGPERNGIPSEMPAWKGKLPKELIWSVLYFLEYQSGGIEGRFPPSLYPRRGATDP